MSTQGLRGGAAHRAVGFLDSLFFDYNTIMESSFQMLQNGHLKCLI